MPRKLALVPPAPSERPADLDHLIAMALAEAQRRGLVPPGYTAERFIEDAAAERAHGLLLRMLDAQTCDAPRPEPWDWRGHRFLYG